MIGDEAMRWRSKTGLLPITGITESDRSTKRLLQRLGPGRIAVLAHDDLDELAVRGLLKARVSVVVNTGRTMTGAIASRAVLELLEAGTPLVETSADAFELLQASRTVTVTDNGIDTGTSWVPCRRFTRQSWLAAYRAAQASEPKQLARFIENTLKYAVEEKEQLLEPLPPVMLRTELPGRHVLVVVRGSGYREDFAALKRYIRRVRPVLIGVDGGADAILEAGYTPDMIIGDMDSVSDLALFSGAELIVHSYRNGEAPGMERLRRLGLEAALLPTGGTSEDAALLLAYEQGCEQIVTVGLHSHMQDFMEKGRKGMGSTWLVRMKIGSRLVDARGISRLYPANERRKPARPGTAWLSFVRFLH